LFTDLGKKKVPRHRPGQNNEKDFAVQNLRCGLNVQQGRERLPGVSGAKATWQESKRKEKRASSSTPRVKEKSCAAGKGRLVVLNRGPHCGGPVEKKNPVGGTERKTNGRRKARGTEASMNQGREVRAIVRKTKTSGSDQSKKG